MTSFYSEKEIKEIGFKFIGEGVLVSRKASIYGAENICIGNNVRIDDFCILSGKIEIMNYVHISASVLLFGGKTGIIINSYASISSRSAVYAESDDYTGIAMANPTIPGKYRKICSGIVTFEEHVLIGSGCTVLPGVTVKEGTSVGSMSLINKSLESWGFMRAYPVNGLKTAVKKF